MNSSLHSLIPFLPLFNCQLSSIPLLPSSYPGKLASRNSIYSTYSSEMNLLYKYFAGTTQKTQPLYCWEGVFITPLNTNGSYSIFACVFVAAGMCLPSRCIAMNVYSDFTIPAFDSHVTIWKYHEIEVRKNHSISVCNKKCMNISKCITERWQI
jgi:hypothetical protein